MESSEYKLKAKPGAKEPRKKEAGAGGRRSRSKKRFIFHISFDVSHLSLEAQALWKRRHFGSTLTNEGFGRTHGPELTTATNWFSNEQ
jgi:hypothetical protein